MTLRSVFTKTLRDQRIAIIAWGLGLGVLVLSTGIGWFAAYPDVESRTRIAASIEHGLSATEVFYGEPRDLVALPGILEWRALGLAPVILGLFMVITVSGVTRGAEESRRVEVVLSAGPTRRLMLLQQFGAALAALGVSCALVAICVGLAGPAVGEGLVNPLHAGEAMLNLAAAAALFAAIALLTAQLTTSRRTAGLVAAVLLFAAHIWNGLGLIVPAIAHVRALSPLYFYSRSAPLALGHMDWPAFAVLVVSTVAVTAVAVTLSIRRDLFAAWRPAIALPHRRGYTRHAGPARDWSLRGGIPRGVAAALGSSTLWAGGMCAFAVLTTALVPNARKAILEQSGTAILDRIQNAGLTSERGVLELLTFSFLPLLITLFAVVLSAAWAQDELSGRLEMEIASPQPRWRLFLERFAGNSLVLAATLALCAMATVVTVELSGMDVPAGVVVGGAILLLPLAALFAAVGQAMAALRPRAAVALTGGVLAASYLAGLVLPLFDTPSVVLNVSVFHLYGQPLIDGPNWGGTGVLVVLTAGVLAGGAMLFERRDLVR